MSKKLELSLVMALIFALSVPLAFAKSTERRSKPIPVSVVVPAGDMVGQPPKVVTEQPAMGVKYQTSCEDIDPEVGTIIQHDQIGSTYYEYQQNGSMGRMIAVGPGGHRHTILHETRGPYSVYYPRWITYNCKDTLDSWLYGSVGYRVNGGTGINAGYANIALLHDGREVVIYHTTGEDEDWGTRMSIGDEGYVCNSGNIFYAKYDIPDASGATELGMWPKEAVKYDADVGTDYIHVVMTEGKMYGGNQRLLYVRCHVLSDGNPTTPDPLLCETPSGQLGVDTTSWVLPPYPTIPPLPQTRNVAYFGECPNVAGQYPNTISAVVVASPVSRKVAIVFTNKREAGTNQYNNDVFYFESTNNGIEWFPQFGGTWPPTQANGMLHNITNYPTDVRERAYTDVAACYDYNDSLHIVWTAAWYDSVIGQTSNDANLYHWSKATGISMIASGYWGGTNPGYCNRNISKMSISAMDTIYHPGGNPDSVYLYCIWTQFDTGDNSANSYTNGEVYGSGSFDGGNTWGGIYNLTNTKTPNCAPGSCLSEHWSSLAQTMYNGDLHIQYICDRDPGWAIGDYPSQWMDNPAMYLHLSAWPVTRVPRVYYRIDSPNRWYGPPLKIAPWGSQTLPFELFNIGNDNLHYWLQSDNPQIQVSVNPEGWIVPRASVTVEAIVEGYPNRFIDGNLTLQTNEGGGKSYQLPVQAIVANDYFECPYDPQTYNILENGVLCLYTNANGQEWIHDIGTFPGEKYEVFFNGGTIVATTQAGDTLVGRYMGENDQHAGAREKLYINDYNDHWILYTRNVFMHDLNPPADTKWWWWEMSQEIVFFKNNATEARKHLVIKYVTAERHDPPSWWPTHPPFTGYEDTYVGMAMDINCPWGDWWWIYNRNRAGNWAGYDDGKNIAWQRGWTVGGYPWPPYDNYYCGIALADPTASLVPYGAHNVRSDVYLYPQVPWGWKDGELYQLASTSGNTVQAPDSSVDRAQVLTAQKINAGNDPNARVSFTVVEVVAPGGLEQLQAYVDTARAWVQSQPSVTANFCGSPDSGYKPLSVQFTDLSTGWPTSWHWDFGDGKTDMVKDPIHTYTDAGDFDVRLIASNSTSSDTIIKPNYITVFDTLTVDFTAQPTHGRKPLNVAFQSIFNHTPYNVKWYFGDGQTSNQLNPIHKYTGFGNYDVKLVAELFGYKDSLTKEDYIRVSDIKAEFASNKRCGSVPLDVTFSDSSTSSYAITNWYWDFGDGDTSSQQNPIHQFTSTEAFDITLIVSDSIGADTLKKQGYITTQDSVSADFIGLPNSGKSPLTVMFEPVLEGIANQYFWDFGDGDTSSLRNPIHTYTTQGKYDVKLRVRLELDDCDQVDSMIKEDYVVVHDLEAKFSANPTAGIKSLTVQFTDSSSGNPDTWFWDFGDRNTSTAQNPSHQYDTAGVYDVFLRVSNPLGVDSLLKLDYILVTDTPYTDLSGEIYSFGGRRGFSLLYYFVWTNIGSIPAENCTLKILRPSEMTFYGVYAGIIRTGTYSGYNFSGDTIIIPLATVTPSNYCGGYVTVYGNLPATVPIGRTLVCQMWSSSTTPDQNYSNNYVMHRLVVTGSIDPNDKLASPEGEGTSHSIEPDQRLAYTIQFENKPEATAEAIYIRVVDTLDQDLDWGTLAIGASSHPEKCDYEFDPYTGVIVWFCDSIMLPPNQNPPEGEGYFTFSISPKPELVEGTEISNKAWIRFDYNEWLQAPEEGPVIRTIRYPFIYGDANKDGKINSADVAYLINYLFIGGPAPQPWEAGDANCDGKINSADVAYLINYLFIGGPQPGC